MFVERIGVYRERAMMPALTVAIVLVILEAPYRRSRALATQVSPGSAMELVIHRAIRPPGSGWVYSGNQSFSVLRIILFFFFHQSLRLVTFTQATWVD